MSAAATTRVFYAGRMRTLEAIERRREKNREWSYRMYWDDDAYRRRKLVMDSIRGAEKTIAKYTELLEGYADRGKLFVIPDEAARFVDPGRSNLFALPTEAASL